MQRGGFEPPKALSHRISYNPAANLSYWKSDILSPAHLTALLPLHEIIIIRGIKKVTHNRALRAYSLMFLKSLDNIINIPQIKQDFLFNFSPD